MMVPVLVVEDEPSVLMFVEEGLAERGFEVVSARSAGEALNILGSTMYRFAAMVCDIRLGDGIDGWEIARCARDIEADMPIVYVTGDSAGSWNVEGVANSRLLQKPFSGIELANSINALLDKGAVH